MHSEHAEFLDHLKNERDVTEREAAIIGVYSVVIAVVFFATVFALFTYFKWELDQLRETRIHAVQDPVYTDVKKAAETGLAGAPVKVDDAIRALAEQGKSLPPEPAAAPPAPGQGAQPGQGAPGQTPP